MTPATRAPELGGSRALEEPHGPPLLRDLRRLRRLAYILYVYCVAGSRVRRAYRKAQAEGTTLWLDE
jgi:hypothetical protein